MNFFSKVIFLTAVFSSGTYAVQINVDTSQAPDLAGLGETVKSTLLSWFDRVGDILDSPTYSPPAVINILFDINYDGVAYAAGNQIVGSVKYYRNNPNDIGSMVHEMAHVIQGYRSCYTNDDWWITEGIADWVRLYHYEPQNKPPKPGPANSYTDGYRVTAYFLEYINSRYNPMIYWINKDCREGTYNHNIFERLTGKNLDQHWADMMRDGKISRSSSPLLTPFGTSGQPKCLPFQN